jgi:cysteine-rich repeat protein
MQIDSVTWNQNTVNHGDPAGITIGGRNIGGQQIEVYVYEDDLIGDTLMTPTPLVGVYPLAAPLQLSWNAVWECEFELFGLCIDQPEYIAVARLVSANAVSASTSTQLHVNPIPPMCGNGAIEAGEDCDPSTPICNPLYGGSCGYCSSSCHLITRQGAYCGDGVRNGPEQCDGLDLGGQSCTTLGQGFTQGSLSCTGSCTFNTASCSAFTTPPQGTIEDCGNGIQEGSEQCDDGNGDNGDACTSQCRVAYCGDGFIRAGVEMCEPIGSSCNLPGGSNGFITGNAIGGSTGPGGASTPGDSDDGGTTTGTCSASCQCAP